MQEPLKTAGACARYVNATCKHKTRNPIHPPLGLFIQTVSTPTLHIMSMNTSHRWYQSSHLLNNKNFGSSVWYACKATVSGPDLMPYLWYFHRQALCTGHATIIGQHWHTQVERWRSSRSGDSVRLVCHGRRQAPLVCSFHNMHAHYHSIQKEM